jgi:hypothetical protein
MFDFDPANWYWLADDGRIYSSSAQNVVNAADAGYIAFVASGRRATRWPSDLAGVQSNAALVEVIGAYGLALTPTEALIAYAAAKRYAKETGGTHVTLDGQVVTMPTDRQTQAQFTGAYAFAQVNSALTVQWKLGDGSFVTLTAALVLQVAIAVATFVQAAFATEAAVVAQIKAGSITTTAQIDAAFA